MLKIGYGGWLGHRNLGDEASFLSIKNLFQKNLKTNHKLIKFNYYLEKFPYNLYSKFLKGDLDCNLFICGGGTLLNIRGKIWVKICAKFIKKGIPVIIFGTGIQNLDFNWSDKNKQTKENIELLKYVVNNAALIGIRGPDSLLQLKKIGCEKKIEIIGDPTLAIQLPVVTNLRTKFVGINIGTSYNNIYGNNEDFLKKEVILICNYLIKKGFKLCFFNVWPKDLKVQNEIISKLDKKNLFVYNDRNIKKLLILLSNCEFVIGEKLHSIVFSARCSVPFISLAYRPKCIDFAKSVGCEKYVIKTDEKIFEKFKKLYPNLLMNKSKIKKKLSKKVDLYNSKLNNFAIKVNDFIENHFL